MIKTNVSEKYGGFYYKHEMTLEEDWIVESFVNGNRVVTNFFPATKEYQTFVSLEGKIRFRMLCPTKNQALRVHEVAKEMFEFIEQYEYVKLKSFT